MNLSDIMALIFACQDTQTNEDTTNVLDIRTGQRVSASSLCAVKPLAKRAQRVVVRFPLADVHDALNALVELETHECATSPTPVRLSAAIEEGSLIAVYIFIAEDRAELLRNLRRIYSSLEFT